MIGWGEVKEKRVGGRRRRERARDGGGGEKWLGVNSSKSVFTLAPSLFKITPSANARCNLVTAAQLPSHGNEPGTCLTWG